MEDVGELGRVSASNLLDAMLQSTLSKTRRLPGA